MKPFLFLVTCLAKFFDFFFFERIRLRVILKSGASFKIWVTDYELKKNNRTGNIIELVTESRPGIHTKWIYINLNEIDAIVVL